MIKTSLKPWMGEFSIILREPVPSEDPEDWSIRMEVSLETDILGVQYFLESKWTNLVNFMHLSLIRFLSA